MNKVIITLLLMLSTCWGSETKKVRIGTFLIPKYVQSPSKGEFVQLVNMLAKKANVEIEIVLIPAKRAYIEVTEGSIVGMFPAMESRDLSNFEKTTSFYPKEMFVFWREGHDYTKLSSPKVCVAEGYTYPEDYMRQQGWKKVTSKTDATCLVLLSKKRVDLFVSEIETGVTEVKNQGLEKVIKYDRYRPISSDKATLIFRKGPEGKILSEKFDKALKELMMNSTYQKLFNTGTEKIES